MSKKAKHKTVETLEQNDCRWPIGDPRHADFHFCGAHRVAGRPYCEHHWQQSFVSAKARQEQYASPPLLLVKRAA
jgi:GcrA cell cycle regulator